ncbi:MAG TPA: hypothetical protein PK733_05965 [Clostridiales bacterium]|nr:hypothetical protein [Clostridiales bacterium]
MGEDRGDSPSVAGYEIFIVKIFSFAINMENLSILRKASRVIWQ